MRKIPTRIEVPVGRSCANNTRSLAYLGALRNKQRPGEPGVRGAEWLDAVGYRRSRHVKSGAVSGTSHGCPSIAKKRLMQRPGRALVSFQRHPPLITPSPEPRLAEISGTVGDALSSITSLCLRSGTRSQGQTHCAIRITEVESVDHPS